MGSDSWKDRAVAPGDVLLHIQGWHRWLVRQATVIAVQRLLHCSAKPVMWQLGSKLDALGGHLFDFDRHICLRFLHLPGLQVIWRTRKHADTWAKLRHPQVDLSSNQPKFESHPLFPAQSSGDQGIEVITAWASYPGDPGLTLSSYAENQGTTSSLLQPDTEATTEPNTTVVVDINPTQQNLPTSRRLH